MKRRYHNNKAFFILNLKLELQEHIRLLQIVLIYFQLKKNSSKQTKIMTSLYSGIVSISSFGEVRLMRISQHFLCFKMLQGCLCHCRANLTSFSELHPSVPVPGIKCILRKGVD